MYVIIVGCGKVGARFANILSDDGHDVVIIDNDVEKFKKLPYDFRGITMTGVPIDQDILRTAGIENADIFAAVTPDDNINIMACQIAQEIYKVPKVLARIYNPERENIFHDFGLQTICPTNVTVESIRSLLMDEDEPKNLIFGRDNIFFSQNKVPENLVGKALKQIKMPIEVFIFGVIRAGNFIHYKEDLILNEQDLIVTSKKVD